MSHTKSPSVLLTARLAVAAGLAMLTTLAAAPRLHAAEPEAKQEFYELRVYRIPNADKQKTVSDYLQKALVPALNRMGIDRVGVFTLLDKPDNHDIYVLIPYPTLEALSELPTKLADDSAYQKAAADFFAQPMKDPPYTRIESRLMKAFAGLPVMELPDESKQKKPRLFELRTYESHNTDKALAKVDMFNSGEIQVMRDVKLNPVFYGQTLISNDVPNLTYMLSAPDMDAHKAHWKAFGADPRWNKLKGMAKYKDTVSKITNWFLSPTGYSQI
jgi:NIPSNAP